MVVSMSHLRLPARKAMAESFRSRTSRVGGGYAIGVGAIALFSTVSTFRSGRWPIGLAVGAVAISIIVYGRVVLWRVGVVMNGESIILHGPLGRRVIELDDADRFEFVTGWPWRAWLVMRDGRRLKVTGIGASGWRHRASMAESEDIVRDLNASLDRHRRL
jgi:hypothetical protein